MKLRCSFWIENITVCQVFAILNRTWIQKELNGSESMIENSQMEEGTLNLRLFDWHFKIISTISFFHSFESTEFFMTSGNGSNCEIYWNMPHYFQNLRWLGSSKGVNIFYRFPRFFSFLVWNQTARPICQHLLPTRFLDVAETNWNVSSRAFQTF